MTLPTNTEIIRPLDGQRCWLLRVGTSIYDSKGKLPRFKVLIKDISEQKKA